MFKKLFQKIVKFIKGKDVAHEIQDVVSVVVSEILSNENVAIEQIVKVFSVKLQKELLEHIEQETNEIIAKLTSGQPHIISLGKLNIVKITNIAQFTKFVELLKNLISKSAK